MRVLVANRGEIAVRVIHTLKALGATALAVYEPADAGAPHVLLADAALPSSYSDGAALVAAARALGATAVHPGYGFLSQSPAFAELCAAAGLVFIGPSPACMRALGDKRAARALAADAGIPVVPRASACDDLNAAHAAAERLGYPLLIKAAGGGGGRGMRAVATPDALASAHRAAAREAAAFGDPRLLVERLIRPARHIEVQVLGDGRQAIALGERECSLQRRFQKVVEESPAPHLTASTRASLEAAAVRLASRAGYLGAGTVEFLLAPDGQFFFLEVNTRLQVEHPVTELCCGLDLVAQQVALAHGGPLPPSPAGRGHAIEVRLNAEDPGRDFLPAAGVIEVLQLPHMPGVRIDTAATQGGEISPLYDPLVAKVIAHGDAREAARQRLVGALRQLTVLGPRTNQAFLLSLLEAPWFVAGETYTHTLEALPPWSPPAPPDWLDEAVAAWRVASEAACQAPAVGDFGGDVYSPWQRPGQAIRCG